MDKLRLIEPSQQTAELLKFIDAKHLEKRYGGDSEFIFKLELAQRSSAQEPVWGNIGAEPFMQSGGM